MSTPRWMTSGLVHEKEHMHKQTWALKRALKHIGGSWGILGQDDLVVLHQLVPCGNFLWCQNAHRDIASSPSHHQLRAFTKVSMVPLGPTYAADFLGKGKTGNDIWSPCHCAKICELWGGKKKATFKSQEKSTEARIRCGCFPGSIAKNLLWKGG